MKVLRFHWLEGGYCRHLEKSTYRLGAWKPRDYPSFFGVLEHPSEGIFLFDTGYSPRFHEATAKFPEKFYAMMTPVTCAEKHTSQTQLRRLGHSPDDVKGIFVSHFHADHVAALHFFPKSKIYFTGAGLKKVESLSRWQQVKNGFLAGLVPSDIWSRAVMLEDARAVSLPSLLAPFTRGFDFLGDSSMLAVPLGGHMFGQTGLFFQSQKGPVFLIADAVWHSNSYRHKVGPHFAARLLMHDWAEYQNTIRRLHELHRRGGELNLVPSHCTEFRGVFSG